MPSVSPNGFIFNQSRVEEISQNPDVRALAERGSLPNTSITQLKDVGGPAPLANQALAWNPATGKYEPTTFAGPGSGLLQPDDTLIVDAAIEASQQFALATIPAVNTLMVAVNGIMQRYPADYTLAANLVTFTEFTVEETDTIWAKYQ